MIRSCSFVAWLAAVFVALTGSAFGERYCGIALSTGHEPHRYYAWETRQVLLSMRWKGATDVQISAYTMQTGVNATTSRLITDKAALAYVFRLAHRIGLRVFFKPVVEVETFQRAFVWRGRILGTDAWFNKVYIPFITDMARLAETHGVETMSVGSEYRASLEQTKNWVRTIATVRTIYTGKLTYIANHDSYHDVSFFHLLDFVSISAYFRLIFNETDPIPSPKQTKILFDRRLAKLNRWRIASGLSNKKVLVGEIGFQSKGGNINYHRPWAWTAEGPHDTIVQRVMYEAFLSSFLSKPWSLGVMIWHYELNVNAGLTYAKLGYTPQNKPAQWVMKRYFKSYCRENAYVQTNNNTRKPTA